MTSSSTELVSRLDGFLTDQVGVAAHGARAMCEPARGGGPIQDLAVLDGNVDGLPDGSAYLRGWHLGIGNIVILKSANAHRMRDNFAAAEITSATVGETGC